MRFVRPADFRNGFTLMELLTVMVIMGILLTAGVASYFGARRGAEMRGAVGAIRSVMTTARQNAVTHRRTTVVALRREGPEDKGTNCYYIFEKYGEAKKPGTTILYTEKAPLPSPEYWPHDIYICNFDSGAYGQIAKICDPYQLDNVGTSWIDSGEWKVGDSYGLQIIEKGYLPPVIDCFIDGNASGLIRFYSNGKSNGMAPITIMLIDKINTNIKKQLTVYPLLGLVKEEK